MNVCHRLFARVNMESKTLTGALTGFIAVTIICIALSSTVSAESGWETVMSQARIGRMAAGGQYIWVAVNADYSPNADPSAKGKLVRIDTADNSEHIVANRLDDYLVFALAVAENGDVWMSSFPDGFMHLTIEAGEIADVRVYTLDDGLLTDRPLRIATGPDGMVWAGGDGRVTGLVGLDPASDRFIPVERFADVIVGDILFDGDGRLWVTSSDGVSCLSDGVWEDFGTDDGLASESVSLLAEGLGGDIWGGSYAEVVSRYSEGTWTPYGEIDEAGIDQYRQRAEAKQILGQIMGLEKTYYYTNARYVTFAFGEDCPSIGFAQPGNARFTYAFTGDTAQAREIVDMNGDGDTVDGITLSTNNERGILPGSSYGWDDGRPTSYLQSMVVDRNGTVWCGNYPGGINCFDGTVWSDPVQPAGISDNGIKMLVVTDDGDLWCSTDTGLYRKEIATSVADDDTPRSTALEVTFNPNPFNAATTVAFTLDKPSDVTVTVYNTLGQSVRALLERRLPAGSHAVRWEGASDHGARISTGVYIIQVDTGNARHAELVTFLK